MWSAKLAGTPNYLAPERLRDDPPLDRRSDVYSLGVTMYQLLSGELPFHDPSLAEVLRQVSEDEPAPLRTHVPSVPPELEAIVGKCLAKDPDARYPSARAVAEDLWRYLDGEEVEAHASTLTYRLSRPAVRKRNLLAAALAVAVLAAALLAAFVVSTATRARQAAAEAIIALDSLAALHHEEGRYEEAEDVYLRTLALREEHLGRDHPSVAHVLSDLAALHLAHGEAAAAEREARRAVEILARTLPEGDPRRAAAEGVLAAALEARAREDGADED